MSNPSSSKPLAASNISQVFTNLFSHISPQYNPMVMKEMRSVMRGARAFIIITIYLVLLGGLVSLIYLTFASSNDVSTTSTIIQGLGKTVFGAVIGVQMMLVCFLSPALTAGAIAAERERQTYDLLRTTLLSGRSLVEGKLVSALLFLFMLLLAGLPVQSMAFLFGGISIEEILVGFLMVVVTAVLFSAIGLFVSSFTKTTLISTVVSYILAILFLSGTVVLLAIAATLVGVIESSTTLTAVQENTLLTIMFTIGYILVILNPMSAAVASEIMLISEQELFFMNLPIGNGIQYPIVSPWIPYTVIALVLGILLVRLTVIFVRRVER